MPRLGPVVALGLLVALAACAGAPDDDDSVDPLADDDDDDDATEAEPTWETVYGILSYRCTCHRANEGARGGFTGMEGADSAYDNLVDRASNDVPSMARVEPGEPDASYAVLKIGGEHLAAGGEGTRMPPTGHALPEDQQDLIREWVELGAPLD